MPARVDAFAGQYGAAGFYCNVFNGEIVTNPTAGTGNPAQSTLQPVRRGTAFKSDWLTVTNVTFQFRLPIDAYDAFFRVDIFNLFGKSRVPISTRWERRPMVRRVATIAMSLIIRRRGRSGSSLA